MKSNHQTHADPTSDRIRQVISYVIKKVAAFFRQACFLQKEKCHKTANHLIISRVITEIRVSIESKLFPHQLTIRKLLTNCCSQMKNPTLNHRQTIMSVSDYTIKQIIFSSWVEPAACAPQSQKSHRWTIADLLNDLRYWLDNVSISDRHLAHRLCHLIPAQCPFARKIKLFGWTVLQIPPLCKLNPLYNELMTLRWRALCYLADECGEDINQYC